GRSFSRARYASTAACSWGLGLYGLDSALAPGASAAATIRSFSARDHRRRRCTDVITSTAFVIGLVLVLALGLDAMTHLRKAAVTGRMLIKAPPVFNRHIAALVESTFAQAFAEYCSKRRRRFGCTRAKVTNHWQLLRACRARHGERRCRTAGEADKLAPSALFLYRDFSSTVCNSSLSATATMSLPMNSPIVMFRNAASNASCPIMS